MTQMNKKCSRCGDVKELSLFYKSKKEKDGHMHRCKTCDHANARARGNKKAEYMRRYTNTDAYKQRMAEKRRSAILERLQKKIVSAAELTDAQVRRWRRNAAARYFNRLQATPKWLSVEQKQRTTEIYATTQRLQELTATTYHVDHTVPLCNESVCGLHVWWNLQPLTERDNISKHTVFDPAIFPEQGEVAFPDGAGPTTTRNVAPEESEY